MRRRPGKPAGSRDPDDDDRQRRHSTERRDLEGRIVRRQELEARVHEGERRHGDHHHRDAPQVFACVHRDSCNRGWADYCIGATTLPKVNPTLGGPRSIRDRRGQEFA